MRYSMKVVVGTIVVATSTAIGGTPTGEDVLATYNAGMMNLLVTLDDDVDVITTSCIAKLAAMDARGASDAQLEAVALACNQKVVTRFAKSTVKLRKLVTRTMSSLGQLFEPDLVDQVTELVATYEDVVVGATLISFESNNAVAAALAAEIAD